MKQYRNLSPLDDFKPYRPSQSASARVRSTAYSPAETLSRGQIFTSWVCRIIASCIMIETLFFKFTGASESVYIFSQMNMEAWWRYGQGVWELVASLLLLTPRLGWAGGILTLGALGAAIVSHLTVLGIEIQGDHGLLFGMAIVTFICGFTVTLIHRHEIPSYTPMTPW
jgi:putative oxidoreductase